MAQPNGNDQPTTKNCTDTNFLKLNGDNVMAGPFNMSNNKITNLGPAISDNDGLSTITADGRYLKLIGGPLSGNLLISTVNIEDVNNNFVLNYSNLKYFFTQSYNPSVHRNLKMFNNKIINLADPTNATDGVNLRTLNTHIIKPSDHTNRFAYLMNPKNGLLQWTDLLIKRQYCL